MENDRKIKILPKFKRVIMSGKICMSPGIHCGNLKTPETFITKLGLSGPENILTCHVFARGI